MEWFDRFWVASYWMALLVKRSKSHSESEEKERWFRWGEHVINQGSSQPAESHCKADVDLSRCLHTGKYFEGMTACERPRLDVRWRGNLNFTTYPWQKWIVNGKKKHRILRLVWFCLLTQSAARVPAQIITVMHPSPSSATSTSLTCKKLTLNIEETAAS